MDFHHQLVTYLRDLKYKMKIKFCGIKNIDDLKFIIEKNINYAGFIFYKKSKRFVDDKLLISCKVDGIRPSIIQRSGKKPLELSKVLNGWKVASGTIVKSKL